MKNLFYTLFAGLVLFSCQQQEPDISTEKSEVQLSLRDIFFGEAGSAGGRVNAITWAHVLGGNGSITFDNVDNDYTASYALDGSNLGAGTYSIPNGNYDITVDLNSVTPADYLPYTASLLGQSISSSQTLTFDAVTTFGLVLLGLDSVDQTVTPTFNLSSTDYDLTLDAVQEFYYLYVPGATTGTLTATETFYDQSLSLEVNVSTSTTHAYAFKITSSDAGIGVNFTDFTVEENDWDIDGKTELATPSGTAVSVLNGNYQGPELEATPSGGYIVSSGKWSGGIEGVVYDNANSVVGTFSTGHLTQFESGLAVLDNGEFITARIVGSEIRVVIFNPNASVKVTDFALATGVSDPRNVLAVTDGTNYTIAFSSGGLNLYKLDANGSVLAGPVQPGVAVNQNSSTATRARGMEMAMKSDGEFVLTTRSANSYNNLTVVEFNADYTIKTPAFDITPNNININFHSRVEINNNGQYAITFANVSDKNIGLMGYTMGGNLQFSEVSVGVCQSPANGLTVKPNGEIILAYNTNTTDHAYRIYDFTGNPLTDEKVFVTVAGHSMTTDVEMIGSSQFVIRYNDYVSGYNQYAQKFDM